MRQKVACTSLLLIGLLPALGACDKKDEAANAKTQVVAKVNGDEITVHQLNYELSTLSQTAGQNLQDGAARQVGEQLVNQQLLMQKAVETKLDRDPQIMQALERARRQVLAQAYLDKTVGTPATPGKEEVIAYYNQHPELFSKRRIYQIREVVMDKSIPFAEIQSKLASVKSAQEVADWLESKKVQAKVANIVRPAEQLPFEMLAKLAQMQNGQIAAIETPTNNVLLFLAASQDQPMAQEQAVPVIERFLINKKRKDQAEAEVKRLRESAKIEWMGKFAAETGGSGSAAPGAGNAPPLEGANQKEEDFMGKGVSDLQ
ncbi:MAG: peptidyl-prolyl cis-trans isomerase, EpsD family [Gammaproteobacteria bacterium]|nr:peptidyl-prolyl cis-trans isomerase, EpsD family [Gammaproteobacteria bacterium]